MNRDCLNCNRLILNEIVLLLADPTCLRLNVLTQMTSHMCVICNDVENVARLSPECRVQIFIDVNIYVPENVRSCQRHLDTNGLLLNILLPGLRFINRPYVIKGPQLLMFLQQLRNTAGNKVTAIDENTVTDEEFQCVAPLTKDQFRELFTYCDPVVHNGKLRHIKRKDFLKIIFDYPTRQTVSSVIDYVRASLMQRFVPANIGPESITRENFIAQHVTEFANTLYNPRPEEPKAIAAIDSTYSYVQKSTNFQVLRQSYSLHKHRHLLKPVLVVAPNGYILAIFGPYFSDTYNNDASILQRDFERDGDSLREWFENGDILLVDRGYRDAIPFLERLGIRHKMPALLQRGQRQYTTDDANATRIVTKNRWIVEARNGHLRSMFKFLAQTIIMPHAKNLSSFYRIAGATINRYHPVIHMDGATAELGREILERALAVNVVQARVEVDNLRMRNGQWVRLNHRQVLDLTIGVYQVNLAPSYIQDKLLRDNHDELQLDEHINEPGLIRIRVYSRFRNATRHQIFISYKSVDDDEVDDEDERVLGYYCTCQSGARTLGTCAHVASILWFLGVARHQENIKYPDTSMLDSILDVADRGNQAMVHHQP